MKNCSWVRAITSLTSTAKCGRRTGKQTPPPHPAHQSVSIPVILPLFIPSYCFGSAHEPPAYAGPCCQKLLGNSLVSVCIHALCCNTLIPALISSSIAFSPSSPSPYRFSVLITLTLARSSSPSCAHALSLSPSLAAIAGASTTPTLMCCGCTT